MIIDSFDSLHRTSKLIYQEIEGDQHVGPLPIDHDASLLQGAHGIRLEHWKMSEFSCNRSRINVTYLAIVLPYDALGSLVNTKSPSRDEILTCSSAVIKITATERPASSFSVVSHYFPYVNPYTIHKQSRICCDGWGPRVIYSHDPNFWNSLRLCTVRRTKFLHAVKLESRSTGWNLPNSERTSKLYAATITMFSPESKQLTEGIGDVMTKYNSQPSGLRAMRTVRVINPLPVVPDVYNVRIKMVTPRYS